MPLHALAGASARPNRPWTRARATAAARRAERDIELVKRRVAREVRVALEVARTDIIKALAAQPTEWQAAQLRHVLVEVERSLNVFGAVAGRAARVGALDAAERGIELAAGILDEPTIGLSAGPIINPNELGVAFDSVPALIRGVSDETINRVATILRRAVLAQVSPFEAMRLLGPITGRGVFATAFDRSETIIRTELHRISQVASQATLNQATVHVPDLQKRWISSLDPRTRSAHAKAHGQTVPVRKPFRVWGENLRFPGDPWGRAENTINCRCVVVPHRVAWDQQQPGGHK